MSRLIFINRFFYPDHSATSQLLSDLTFHLARAGRDVLVVTSRSRYGQSGLELPAYDQINGVAVHRLSTGRYDRTETLGRAFDDMGFYRAVRRFLLAATHRGDTIIAKTDPPLLTIPAGQAARRRGARMINWLHDLYPEIAAALKVPLLAGPAGRMLANWRDRALRASSANVVVGELMAETLRRRGVALDQIKVFHNWVNDSVIRPVPSDQNSLRAEWNLHQKFVVGYSGNLGRAHEYHTILGAADRLRNRPDVMFLVIGGGFYFDSFRKEVDALGLSNQFRFLPYQDQQTLKTSLSVADVHWISLKPELEGLLVPSKIYGIAAAGRPIIGIASAEGEVARLLTKYQCGISIAPGDSERLASQIEALSINDQTRTTMGANARRMIETNFSRRLALQNWTALLSPVA